MRRVLVTGANKGIGLAIVEAILNHAGDSFVYLGSRSEERGKAAVASLVEKDPSWADRISLLVLDVASGSSVRAAAQTLLAACPGEAQPLYGIVNNAGVGFGTGSLEDTLQVNAYGIQRVCDAFLPSVQDEGRVVNVTSAAGPIYVSNCERERMHFFTDHNLKWEDLRSFMETCTALKSTDDEFLAHGLGSRNSYGLSKACANSYTLILARENPRLMVSACTPGFIETDLTRTYAQVNNQSVEDMGMKQPAEGTKSALFALFEPLEASGYYYGSDAVRSPIDRYRGPGDPAYTGE